MATSMRGVGSAVCMLLLMPLLKTDAANKREPVLITEDNWRQMLEGEWMVKFYAPWCPACKGVEPAWKSFAEWGEDLDISVADVDVTQEPGLSGRFMVTSLPTIYHVIDGEFRRYMGPRSKDDFITFIEERKYVDLETVSTWKSPNSISMSLLSWLFKISMIVRNIHTALTEDYNVPVYGSYALFAVATIMMGLLLGVALVFLTDCLCPTRPPKHGWTHSHSHASDGRAKTTDRESPGGEEVDNDENEEMSENTGDIDSSDRTLRQRKTKSTSENGKKEEDEEEETEQNDDSDKKED